MDRLITRTRWTMLLILLVGSACSDPVIEPVASDPDGDSLTFSIENKPDWASFETSDGEISGTPTLGDVGSYSNIRLSVSDGQLTAAMPVFTIEVTQVATASTTLTWTAPTLNEDGTTLTDLDGFIIYYGTSSRTYTNEIRIENESVNMLVVENLSPGTYFFAAKAFNLSGVESGFSGELVRTLQ